MSTLIKIKNSVIEMEPETTVKLISNALNDGIPPMEIIQKGLIAGIEVVGAKFKADELFLPEVMASAKAFKDGFEILSPLLKDTGYKPKGRIVMGSVQGDIHDIGKNIIIALFQGNGYEVHDAGVDVPPEKFVKMVKELKPNVIGMSSLLTTTMAKMDDTVKALNGAGIRNAVKVIIGGAPVSKSYADEIGADGYGDDVAEAVELVNNMIAG